MLWTARHWWLTKTTSGWIRSWSLCVRPCNCVSTEATRTLHLNTLALEVQYDCVAEQKCHNQMLQIMRWGFTNISSPRRSWQNLLQLLCKYIDIYTDLIWFNWLYCLSVWIVITASHRAWHAVRSWRCPDQIEQWVAQDATLDQECCGLDTGYSDAFTVKGIAEKEFGPRGTVRIHVEFTRHDSTWYYTVGYDSDQLLCLLLAQALIRACRRLVRQFLMKRGPQRWVNLCQSMPVQRRVQLCRYKRAYQHIYINIRQSKPCWYISHFEYCIQLDSIGGNDLGTVSDMIQRSELYTRVAEFHPALWYCFFMFLHWASRRANEKSPSGLTCTPKCHEITQLLDMQEEWSCALPFHQVQSTGESPG